MWRKSRREKIFGRRRGKLGARPHCRDERTSPASLSQEGAREGRTERPGRAQGGRETTK
jgi:hypothetical protein